VEISYFKYPLLTFFYSVCQLVSSCLFSVGYGYRYYTIVKSKISYAVNGLVLYKNYIFSFFRWKKSENEVESRKNLHSTLVQQYKELGPFSWQECTIIILFVLVIGLWVTRDFSSSPGWDILFRKK
jgi:hypothetical protein